MRNPITQNCARSLRNHATDTERHLWRSLRNRQLGGHSFRRQAPIGNYIADFACLEAKLVVELDGGQHLEQAEYDARRDRQMEAQGFRVLRFWDNQVFQEMQAVLEVILQALEEKACPHPNPPPQAEEGDKCPHLNLPTQPSPQSPSASGRGGDRPFPRLRGKVGMGAAGEDAGTLAEEDVVVPSPARSAGEGWGGGKP